MKVHENRTEFLTFVFNLIAALYCFLRCSFTTCKLCSSKTICLALTLNTWLSEELSKINKQEIREHMLALRQQLDESIQVKAAQQFAQEFSQASLFQNSQRIAFYMPFNGELDPGILLKQAWQQGKHCFLPVVSSDALGQMAFFSYFPDDSLSFNQYGILEPDPKNSEKCLPEDLDLVLLPLIAFDDEHHRLGMGAGYYDKTFAFLRSSLSSGRKPYLLGLAYDFQHCLRLPVDPWDVTLDEVWKIDLSV